MAHLFIPLHTGLSSAAQLELATFFVIGLLGGAHCLGMCGPLVTMYASQLDDSSRSSAGVSTYELRQHGLFNLGRTVSYAALGGVFGLAGALFFGTATIVTVGDTFRAVVGILVGIAILVMGLNYLMGGHGGHGLADLPGVRHAASGFGRLQTALSGWVQGPGIVGLGLIHGLLPCPILYPAYLYAFARGSPVAGVVTLGILGLGTFPTLFIYGTVLQSIGATHRQRLHRVLGVAFLVLGVMPIAHSLAVFGIHIPHVEPPIYQPFTP